MVVLCNDRYRCSIFTNCLPKEKVGDCKSPLLRFPSFFFFGTASMLLMRDQAETSFKERGTKIEYIRLFRSLLAGARISLQICKDFFELRYGTILRNDRSRCFIFTLIIWSRKKLVIENFPCKVLLPIFVLFVCSLIACCLLLGRH